MDFYAQQTRARRQTTMLVCIFVLAVLAFLVVSYFLLAACIQPFLKPLPHMSQQQSLFVTVVMMFSEALLHPRHFLNWLLDARLVLWVNAASITFITLAALTKAYQLKRGGVAVAELLGGRKVDAGTVDAAEQMLRNVVEEMAIASATPVPDIFILDRERGINTFAAGHTRDDIAIGVTLGCLKLLNRDELQGVIAHEFSHILNGDTRLNMRLMALTHGLLWPTITGRVLLYGTDYEPLSEDSLFDAEAPSIRTPLLPLALVLFAIGGISTPFVRTIKSLICRERERLADAEAVHFTRNPTGIENALKKVGGLLKQGRLDTPHAEAASHLYFVNSRHESWFSFQSTHPPLPKRITAIDPSFDGSFKHIRSLPSRDAELDQIYARSVERARAEAGISGQGN